MTAIAEARRGSGCASAGCASGRRRQAAALPRLASSPACLWLALAGTDSWAGADAQEVERRRSSASSRWRWAGPAPADRRLVLAAARAAGTLRALADGRSALLLAAWEARRPSSTAAAAVLPVAAGLRRGLHRRSGGGCGDSAAALGVAAAARLRDRRGRGLRDRRGARLVEAVGYWVHPVMRVIGPLPATAWLPLAFFIFPTSGSASTFLIALATAFPVTVLTWSGVAGVQTGLLRRRAHAGRRPSAS